MKDIQPKLRLIYGPFLLIALAFPALYSLLNWLLFIHLELISLKEDLVQFWLPFALPWIPVLLWLRPRIRLLQFKKDNAAFGYQFLAVLAIAAPTMIAQSYLSSATGKRTVLQNPQQYASRPPTKYYALDKAYIDKNSVGIQYVTTTSGKYNQDLNLQIFVALPVYGSTADTATGTAVLWLGKRYRKTISNRLSAEEKQSRFEEFAEACQQEFDTTDFQRFQFLERLGNTYDHDQLKKAVQKSRIASTTDPVVLIAHTEPFEQRNGGKLGWVFKSLVLGAALWLLFLLFPPLDTHQYNRFKNGTAPARLDLKEVFHLFLPRPGFFATPLLMDLTILVYGIMVAAGLGLLSFGTADLLAWGANFRPSTTHGQWWRLLTSTFLHGGLVHLVANMIGLLFVGLFLEPLLGAKRYVLLYLLAGILASCASIWWYPATVSVGASGAIFGLYGTFLTLLLYGVFPKAHSKPFLVSTAIFIAYNLLMGIAGGIDNAAHIGGLASGLVIGLVLAPGAKRKAQAVMEAPFDDDPIPEVLKEYRIDQEA